MNSCQLSFIRGMAVALVSVMAGAVLCAQNNQPKVVLRGYVYSEGGKPIEGAKVSLLPLDTVASGMMPETYSDAHGFYHILAPTWGKTLVSASKAGAGYPDTTWKLFVSRESKYPVVDLTPSVPVNDVDVYLGPPDGTVVGLVVDEGTGKIIPSARILMRWVEKSSVMYSADIISGTFKYALPDREISITITAPGYQPWVYQDETTHQQFIDAKPGTHVSITVAMEHSH